MREIKFRVFEKYNKCMLYPETKGLIPRFISLGGELHKEVTNDYPDTHLENRNKEYIIMQFTGLYDTTKFENLNWREQRAWFGRGKTKKEWNGKEIYTGDILEYWFDSFNPYIGYLTSRSYFANNIPFPDENYKKTGTKFVEQVIYKDGTFLLTDGKDEVYLNMHCRNAKIIGNIYENPKLMNNEITI